MAWASSGRGPLEVWVCGPEADLQGRENTILGHRNPLLARSEKVQQIQSFVATIDVLNTHDTTRN